MFEKNNSMRGNAMIYVLIAIALFGFLTVTMSRQNNQSDGQDISDENVTFYASELMQYSASAQNVIELMLSTGSEMSDLSFLKPASGGFNTAPHMHKVYHPQGGGLTYERFFSSSIVDSGASPYGWRIRNDVDVEWTPSTNDDVVLTALGIKSSVCRALNKIITGNETIPTLSSTLESFFESGGSATFTTTHCAACDGYPSLCVEDNGGGEYGFYNIIAAD